MTDNATYVPASDRYEAMPFRTCGRSGLKLPIVSLGGWFNFLDAAFVRRLLTRAFDLGVTHFDLANNYGEFGGHGGLAEENTGVVLAGDLKAHRDDIIVTSKAGFRMRPGPYGDWGSRKYLLSSLDASLKRLQVDYVDIFYHHRPDPNTPLEETMGALDAAVRQGKALYAAISNYNADQAREAVEIMGQLGTPLIANQCNYSLLSRWIEDGTLDTCADLGLGLVCFGALNRGQLTEKHLHDKPGSHPIEPELEARLQQLNAIAAARGQSLSDMALNWVVRDERVTTVVLGVSQVEQLEQNVRTLQQAKQFKDEELLRIHSILK